MLSLESIEKRLENPKAYYIFYQFFYKAAVGESAGRNAWTSVKHALAALAEERNENETNAAEPEGKKE